jgi:hypothetical protein
LRKRVLKTACLPSCVDWEEDILASMACLFQYNYLYIERI